MNLYFNDQYVGAGHAFDTTRKAGWIATSLKRTPVPDVELVSPRLLQRRDLLDVHNEAYVDAVESGLPESLASSQGFAWDPGLWASVCASNGGVVEAALVAMEDGVAGSLSSGLHHARRDRGAGFCTFNALVLAALASLAKGARRVLILDLDAHCGGGTHELTASDDRIVHLDVSVSSYDSYHPDGDGNQLLIVSRAAEYLTAVEAALATTTDGVDLVLYNAGMDPFEGCDIGGLSGVTYALLAQREALVFGWARVHRLPLAFVLAGGYTGAALDRDALVALHRLTIEASAVELGRSGATRRGCPDQDTSGWKRSTLVTP
jgi:acetoin utilization deacetylase AcuC-like enzyme